VLEGSLGEETIARRDQSVSDRAAAVVGHIIGPIVHLAGDLPAGRIGGANEQLHPRLRRSDVLRARERRGVVNQALNVLLLHVWQQARQTGMNERPGIARWGEVAEGGFVVVEGEAELLEVVGTTHAGRGRADLLHGGEKQTDQDRNDCDHDEQLDEGKCPVPCHVGELAGGTSDDGPAHARTRDPDGT
jgi:hypothetical protein